MSFLSPRLALCTAAILALAACASADVIRTAQPRTVTAEGQKLELGGSYNTRPKQLTIKVNGEPVLSGSFSRFSPVLNLKADYRGLEISANCYFGSILNSQGGVHGIVANAVQGGTGKSSDKCDVSVKGKVVETLFF